MPDNMGSRGERQRAKSDCLSSRKGDQGSEDFDRPAETTHASKAVDAFPTSRFPPVALVRPLKVFGASFTVEVSSHLSLGPDTVLRAAIGKSIQTLLRDEGKLQPLKQMRYALLGKHQLTTTTRSTILRAVGPLSASLTTVLDSAPPSEGLKAMSDWQCVAASWGPLSPDNQLDIILSCFIKLDELGEAAAALKAAGHREDAESMLAARFSRTLPAWSKLCPQLSLIGCLLLDSSLMVLVEAETLGSPGKKRPVGQDSVVETFLDPSAKPIAHWLRQVLSITKCTDLRVLSDLLERRQVRHHGQRPISHDTLKGWSAMKPGMLMSLDGCRSLLEIVSDKQAKDRLLLRFALARFLAFLCDYLLSSVYAGPPSWRGAQEILLTRYLQIAELRDGWLTEKIAGAEVAPQHPLNAINS